MAQISETRKLRVRLVRQILDEHGGEMNISDLADACFAKYDRAGVDGWTKFFHKNKYQTAGGWVATDEVVKLVAPMSFAMVNQVPQQKLLTTFEQPIMTETTSEEQSENGVRVFVPNGNNHIPSGVPELIKTDGVKLILDTLEIARTTGNATGFIGPKGIAKTLAVQWACQNWGISLIIVDCSKGMKIRHLEGGYTETNEGITWVAGPIPQAFELANKYGECMIVFEEVNGLTQYAQKRLNSMLDWQKEFRVAGIRDWKLKAGAKLIPVCTMNPTSHGGTHELNEDFKSRWSLYYIDYPSKSEERDVLTAKLQAVPEALPYMEAFLRLAEESRHGGSSGLGYTLAPRDVIKLATNFGVAMRLKSKSRALALAKEEFMSCFPEEKRRAAGLRFADVFGDV